MLKKIKYYFKVAKWMWKNRTVPINRNSDRAMRREIGK